MSLTENTKPWLTIIGVIENSSETLSHAAKIALHEATELYGSERQLALITEELTPNAARSTWHSPMSDQLDTLLKRAANNTVILASGDPMCWGLGETIAQRLENSAFTVIPAISIISQIAAKLKWPSATVTSLSLCSQSIDRLAAYLQPERHLILLSANAETPKLVADFLSDKGFSETEITLLENLGDEDEKITQLSTNELKDLQNISPLNSLGLTLKAAPKANTYPLVPGLTDDAYENDGQLTKSNIRAITISKLAPTPQAHLWDIGTGAGSIAIEWCRAGESTTASAIEKNPDRLERAKRNAKSLGVTSIEFVEAESPNCLDELKTPDAIFIGGGLTNQGVLETALNALKPSGRLVANAVTIESESKLIEAAKTYGGTLTKIAISEPNQIGNFNAWRPHMPVTQWVFIKSQSN